MSYLIDGSTYKTLVSTDDTKITTTGYPTDSGKLHIDEKETLVFDKDDMKITFETKKSNLLGTHKLTIVAHYKNVVPLKSIVTQQSFNVIYIESSTLPLD